ncbi:MAG: hypothetical protein JOZ55_03130 [Alphaproteobacteria bacterium]|nr:hypothetical protein [Alphaproteobacteria bacterium]
MKRSLFGAGSAALVAGLALAFSAPAAQAFVVCNDQGDCWHASEHYVVPKVHVTFYDDNYDWKAHNYHWHDADGPGYWDTQDNRWVTVKKTTTTTTTTTSTPQ